MSRIAPAVALEVEERADGFCEACGGWLGVGMAEGPSFHHRHARGMGGAGNHMEWIDQAINLMLVHNLCHNIAPGSIHQNPDRSRRLGHIVSLGTDPTPIVVQVVRNLRELRA